VRLLAEGKDFVQWMEQTTSAARRPDGHRNLFTPFCLFVCENLCFANNAIILVKLDL